jgi:hypothetical protein
MSNGEGAGADVTVRVQQPQLSRRPGSAFASYYSIFKDLRCPKAHALAGFVAAYACKLLKIRRVYDCVFGKR